MCVGMYTSMKMPRPPPEAGNLPAAGDAARAVSGAGNPAQVFGKSSAHS